MCRLRSKRDEKAGVSLNFKRIYTIYYEYEIAIDVKPIFYKECMSTDIFCGNNIKLSLDRIYVFYIVGICIPKQLFL